ncbi:cysteine desulfuration protein SufE [Chitinophaga sp. CF118]|uniref:SufE family protein n=1 Tax=Chitinophaga sp. CF118 TaxID=1884367 RepID=UPI0008ECCB58|nr:SufE family protein [Chitinophaga sp. CF118]SFD85129.1 cysteine desulfuration protein SufE [Chitinophaga sp. CF118]
MTIKETQDELISDFSLMENWMDKYEYIIQLGKELPLIDEKYKTPDNIIKGCQSQVWLHTELTDGKLVFTADSDAVITKGLISLMVSVLSNHTPREINEADLYFIEAIGLTSHLSPTRSNGLLSMVKQMKMYAFAYQAKSQSQQNGKEL